ncbi:hypothetical protein B0A50_03441 [Salinomyces thailandicus]|uniref:Uncharacterized protein n=1 Tax=Salinomyces thailandicus TaxID=706561 RepID=A0A4V5N4W3_9PEZI|nr:hypothetical protein B0A50_03441 [Salinomyces thailandica]
MAANALESIRATGTNIIADTADFQGVYLLLQDDSAANGPDRLEIKRYQPTEGTTNPSILLAAARLPAYKHIFSRVQGYLRDTNDAKTTKLSRAVESLAVDFGTEIWRLTGRVSTELDVALSFDVEGTIAAALRIIRLYAANGVPKEGVRIKIAATWEGIQARTWECKGSRLCITYFASRDTRHRSWALQDEKMAHIDDIVPDGQSSNGTSSMEDVDVSSEGAFRWAYNDDACTVEKTAEALRRFASDTRQLEIMLAAR